MKSKVRLLMIIGAASFLSSCQTYKVSLTYNPPSFNQRVIKGEPSIKIDKINDVRNLRGSELGAIKNEFGIAIKAIQAKQPISEITRTAFSHALKSRNLLAEKDAKYILHADVLQFECSQYSTQNAECRIRVHLYQAKTGRLIYSQYYYSTKTKVSPNVSYWSNVDEIAVVASDALQDVVDRAVDDQKLRRMLR